MWSASGGVVALHATTMKSVHYFLVRLKSWRYPIVIFRPLCSSDETLQCMKCWIHTIRADQEPEISSMSPPKMSFLGGNLVNIRKRAENYVLASYFQSTCQQMTASMAQVTGGNIRIKSSALGILNFPSTLGVGCYFNGR